MGTRAARAQWPADQAQLGLIKKSLEAAKANKQYLILDLHNYATYSGKRIGTSDVPAGALADLWRRLALGSRTTRR